MCPDSCITNGTADVITISTTANRLYLFLGTVVVIVVAPTVIEELL